MNKQIVYVLSTNYAGSHFLSLQLGSHTHCASVGELHHFRRKKTRHKACYVCSSDDVCPVFSGIQSGSVRGFYDTIFGNLAAYNSTISTVIDNSKKVRWARRFVDMPGYTKKYIHLIRDPRALVRRWMLSFDEPTKKKMRFKTARRCWNHAWDILTGNEANVYIWDWLYENRQITNFIQKNNLDARLVTYHDLVFKADFVLSELMGWLGDEYDPEQKEYWKFVHHSSVKKSYMQPLSEGQQVFDQRWKTFLDGETQQQIWSHPEILSYLKELNICFDQDGLKLLSSSEEGLQYPILR